MRFELIKIPKRDALNQKELYAPVYESDIEASRKLKEGQRVVGSTSKSDIRNVGHHRKAFALLKLAFENMPESLSNQFSSLEAFRQEITMQIGYYDRRRSLSGREYYIPRSWKFSEMDQAEFGEMYSKIVDFICQFILPETEREELEKEIIDFL